MAKDSVQFSLIPVHYYPGTMPEYKSTHFDILRRKPFPERGLHGKRTSMWTDGRPWLHLGTSRTFIISPRWETCALPSAWPRKMTNHRIRRQGCLLLCMSDATFDKQGDVQSEHNLVIMYSAERKVTPEGHEFTGLGHQSQGYKECCF